MSRRKNRRNRRRARRPGRAPLDNALARKLSPPVAPALATPQSSAELIGVPSVVAEGAAIDVPVDRPSATDAWMQELHAGVERRRRRRRIVWAEALDVRSLLYMGIAFIVAFLVLAVLRWLEWRDVAPRPGF